MKRIIVAGSRSFNDYAILKTIMDNFILLNYPEEEITIVSGCANGADKLGEKYADEKHYSVKRFPPDWEQHKLAAGHIRNRLMAKNADALVCFWDGVSKGSKGMIEIADKKGLLVKVVNYEQ